MIIFKNLSSPIRIECLWGRDFYLIFPPSVPYKDVCACICMVIKYQQARSLETSLKMKGR